MTQITDYLACFTNLEHGQLQRVIETYVEDTVVADNEQFEK